MQDPGLTCSRLNAGFRCHPGCMPGAGPVFEGASLMHSWQYGRAMWHCLRARRGPRSFGTCAEWLAASAVRLGPADAVRFRAHRQCRSAPLTGRMRIGDQNRHGDGVRRDHHEREGRLRGDRAEDVPRHRLHLRRGRPGRRQVQGASLPQALVRAHQHFTERCLSSSVQMTCRHNTKLRRSCSRAGLGAHRGAVAGHRAGRARDGHQDPGGDRRGRPGPHVRLRHRRDARAHAPHPRPGHQARLPAH